MLFAFFRSSDGLTKVNSDSLSSDPPQLLKSKEPTSASFASKDKSPSVFPSQPASPGFNQKRNVETSSTTISNNSIPGIRPKELRYPLDKYLPRPPKREETFVKPRENEVLPARIDVSLFRKIESLLKESQQIREPIINCALPSNDVGLNDSAGSSVSTEDLVAAEFYKATFGIPKKIDCTQKPNPVPAVTVSSPHRGAGDWIETRNVTHSCDPRPKPQPTKEHEREAIGAPLSWDYPHQAPAMSPKSVPTDTCYHRPPFDTYDNLQRVNLSSEDFIRAREVGSDNIKPKLKMSDVFSCSSGPSMSLQTNSSRPKVHRLRKVTMQNACINTDKTNTHVFSIRHNEADVANDFANQNRVKSFIVQELPKVNIRGRLVKQRCGIININPINLTSDVKNTAVLEISHVPDQRNERILASPKRQEFEDRSADHAQNQVMYEDFFGVRDQIVTQTSQQVPNNLHPALSHRLAFNREAELRKTPGTLSKPKIFDTAAHFKEMLSKEFNSGLEPIKNSLTVMVSSLEEFCQVGLNDRNLLKTLSTSSQANPQALHHRFDQMDDILVDELRAWGQRDLIHYKDLKTAIDDLTKEIRTAVDSFVGMKSLNERTKHFLESSTASVQKAVKQINQHDVQRHLGSAEPLRLDKLYAIHSFLQRSQGTPKPSQSSTDSQQELQEEHAEKDEAPIPEEKFGQTFTIEQPVGDGDHNEGNKAGTPRSHVGDEKEEGRDYEDDFIPEEADQLSESSGDVTSTKSTSSSDKDEGDESQHSKVEEMVLRTSGSANGEESTDAPICRVAVEEHPSSAASTVNASQVNMKAQVIIPATEQPSSKVCPSVPSNISYPKMAQFPKIAKNLVNDEPLVRLTNRNTNAVFELRLPEQMSNMNSTLTYNSAGPNDQIQLSIGPERDNTPPTVPARPLQRTVPDNGNNAEHHHRLQDNMIPRETRNISHEHLAHGMNLPVLQPKNACCDLTQGLNLCPLGYLQSSGNILGESSHPIRPQIILQNQSTQFPGEEATSVERLSASILNLFESKINEMVETSKLKLLTGEPKSKDADVQVTLDGDFERAGPSLSKASRLENAQVSKTRLPQIAHQPQTPANSHARGEDVAQQESDGYDSHNKQLELSSDYLLYRQTEKDVRKMLQKKPICPIQMESSLSSVSVPTSLSEFPIKNVSTSSSELAFPLDGATPPFTPTDIQRLNPVPIFDNPSPLAEELNAPVEMREDPVSENRDDSLHNISSHLHPNPNDVLVLHPEVESVMGDVQEAAEPENPTPPTTHDVGVGDGTKIYNIQPYDSDLMSEGEIGYALTSHSYSSGEIVERKKSKNTVDEKRDSPSDVQENVVFARRVNDPGEPLNDSTASNGDSSSSETTTTETSKN